MRPLAALLAGAVLLPALGAAAWAATGAASFAGKIGDHASQRDDVASKISMTDRTIVVLRSQLDRLKRELADNHRVKATTERQIVDLNAELKDAQTRVALLRRDLDVARAGYDAYFQQFSARLVHYHRMRSQPLLGILFNARDLGEFTRRYRYYSYLSRKDVEVLARLAQARDDVAQRTAELERKEEARTQLKRQLERTNVQLQATIDQQVGLVARIQKEQVYSVDRVAKLRSSHAYLVKKIKSLQQAQTLLDQSTTEPREARREPPRVQPGGLLWPVDGDITIVRPFGFNENLVGTSEFSAGIDVRVAGYVAVKAAAAGTVAYCGPFSPTYGNIVMLDHGGAPENLFTIYANLEQIFVPTKKFLEAGAPLGSLGTKAALDGRPATFHFEVRTKTTPVDPLVWLKTRDAPTAAAAPREPPKGS